MASNRAFTALFVSFLVATALSGCFAQDPAPASASPTTTTATGANVTATSTGVANNTTGAAEPPVANFTVSSSNATDPNFTVGSDLAFDASASSDPAGGELSYVWDFGDNETGEGVTANHTYSAAGNYTVVLTVTSSDSGATGNASQVVAVTEAAASSGMEPRVWSSTTSGSGPLELCLPDSWSYFEPEYYVGWTYSIEPATFTTEWWVGNSTLVESGKSSGPVPEGADNVGGCTGGPVAVDAAYKITVVPPGYAP